MCKYKNNGAICVNTERKANVVNRILLESRNSVSPSSVTVDTTFDAELWKKMMEK